MDFSQSLACSGSRGLEKVGGLWLMNSRCLSLGGAGGGGGGSLSHPGSRGSKTRA